jgi:hypothetical protein
LSDDCDASETESGASAGSVDEVKPARRTSRVENTKIASGTMSERSAN